MVNGNYIFNIHWPNSLGLIEGFCTVYEQPWVDFNPQPFALKTTTLTAAPRRSQEDCSGEEGRLKICPREDRRRKEERPKKEGRPKRGHKQNRRRKGGRNAEDGRKEG